MKTPSWSASTRVVQLILSWFLLYFLSWERLVGIKHAVLNIWLNFWQFVKTDPVVSDGKLSNKSATSRVINEEKHKHSRLVKPYFRPKRSLSLFRWKKKRSRPKVWDVFFLKCGVRLDQHLLFLNSGLIFHQNLTHKHNLVSESKLLFWTSGVVRGLTVTFIRALF